MDDSSGTGTSSEDEEDEEEFRNKNRIALENLQGRYSPVYLGEALQYFINEGQFGYLDPISETENLMDLLPLIKEGYASKISLMMLFFIYAKHNKLQDKARCYFDSILDITCSSYYAEFYYDRNNRMSISDAMRKGLINKRLTPQDILLMKTSGNRGLVETIDDNGIISKSIPNYFFQLIISPNIFNIKDLEKNPKHNNVLNYINSESYRQQMIKEHNIIKEVCNKYTKLRILSSKK